MSRVSNSIKNARISFVFLFFTFLFTFISRTIFINKLGTNIVGLISTLQNVIGFLNLAELGLVSAIAGVLYKPLFENNKNEIKDIISIYGYLYRIIGLIILFASILVSFFLPYLFKDKGVSLLYVFCGYFTFVVVTLVSYFISYRQTLLSANQKEYIIIIYTNIANILKVIFQILALYIFSNGFFVWLIIELFFGIIYGFLINRKVNKIYPWLNTSYSHGKNIRKKYKFIFKTIKQVIPHNFGGYILTQTDNIFIFIYSSLNMVTIYTNYTLVLTKITYILTTAFKGVTASIGNLVSEGSTIKSFMVFREFNALFYLLGGTIIITCFYLINPFITLWIGDNYILDRWIIYLLIYNTYIAIIRQPVNLFIGGFVLYRDVWSPVLEGIIKISFSIILGFKYGILGIVLGSTISLTVIMVLWKPYFLFTRGFKLNVYYYWKDSLRYILLLIVTWIFIQVFINYNLLFKFESFCNWLVNACIIFIMCFLIYSFFALIFAPVYRELLKRFIFIFKSAYLKNT